jgi:hypothetical protein
MRAVTVAQVGAGLGALMQRAPMVSVSSASINA